MNENMVKKFIAIKELDLGIGQDTAQAGRGIRWGLITAAIGLAIMAVLLITLFWVGIGASL